MKTQEEKKAEINIHLYKNNRDHDFICTKVIKEDDKYNAIIEKKSQRRYAFANIEMSLYEDELPHIVQNHKHNILSF